MIIMYYTVVSLVFAMGGELFSESRGYNYTNPLNSSDVADEELDTGGLFGTGISFTRWLGLVTVGIGLPSDTPNWFEGLFFAWQTLVLILSIGFIIDSIWSG